MKYIFEFLKLFEGFRKLLNEHFESERKELERQVEVYKTLADGALEKRRSFEELAAQSLQKVEQLRAHIGTLEKAIAIKNTEIERLQNATTAKLKAVDAMPADDVFSTPLYRPRPAPGLRAYDRDE